MRNNQNGGWKLNGNFSSHEQNTILSSDMKKVTTARGDKLVSLFHPSLAIVSNVFMIGLVSLFNGISTFVGYLMPKLFS